MFSRVQTRSLSLALVMAVAMFWFLPVLTARASVELPFELVFPQETSKTYFTSTFGDRRSGGRRHKGNDLMAERMTEVYAAADGVVVEISINRLSGRHLTIDHGDGWTTGYLHLNNDTPGTDDGEAPWSLTVAPAVELGSFVQKGQLIAWVGDSGNAETTAPHTHFEIRYDGIAVDPYDVLVDAYERDHEVELELMAQIAHDLSPWARLQRWGSDFAVD